ncbi:hypothetical protein AB0G15_30270 [Streptosporangium sp. NPDC023825]|uniref:hypothetical protein n=1 Tax=Streptosporangium sp. NPDC023825 TaxID=3154909 RepID=UPI0034449CD9
MAQHEHMSPTEALARARELDALVRNRSRWYSQYLVLFGVATLVMVPVLGFASGVLAVAVSTTLWMAFVAALIVYAARQPVSRHGYGARHGVIMAAWGVLYLGVLLCGVVWFPGEPAWWLPGAVLVSLPPFAGAYLEARR